MTKVPRGCKGKEVIRALMKKGWIVCRISGSHHQLINQQFDHPITVPCHNKPVNPKILSWIIRDAGLTVDEFILLI